MQFTTWIRGMAGNDIRQIQRDSLLPWLVFYPIITALVLRLAVPPLTDMFADQFDLRDYYPLLLGYMLLIAATLMGTVTGFLLIDERDDQTLQALLVTPVPLSFYTFYKILLPVVLSVIITMIALPLMNLVDLPLGPLLVIACGASLFAPIVGLIYVVFSENKVQGFATMKILGAVGMLPVVAYFIPTPWQDLTGLIFPPYFVVKAIWLLAMDGTATALTLYLALGVVGQIGMAALLLQRFHQVAYSS